MDRSLTSQIPFLSTFRENLYALKVFLDRNAQLFVSLRLENRFGTRHNNEQDAWKIENGSYSQLHSLLTRTVEALSFVLLLIDYQRRRFNCTVRFCVRSYGFGVEMTCVYFRCDKGHSDHVVEHDV